MSSNLAFPCEKRESLGHKDQITNVYVWDMDETLILLKSLLNGSYAEAFNGTKDVKKGAEIGKMWEDHILRICDDLFFYEQIENYNEPCLESLSQYDDGRELSDYEFNQDGLNPPTDDSNKRKLAYRHRLATHRYKQGLADVLDQEMKKLWDELYDMTDEYTDGWLSSARAFLEECPRVKGDSTDDVAGSTGTELQNVHILVTSGGLIPSLVKCLLFRLDHFIAPDKVYSSWDVGKLQCFKWIKERYNTPNVQFCVIGDGWEECVAAQTMRWPYVKIDFHPDGSHRFPSLTHQTLGYYFAVVYGSQNTDED